MTPLQTEAHQRHKRFHQAIAERAETVVQPEDRTYAIPNTPFGIAKVNPSVMKVLPNIEPLYWHCMWFADLIAIRAPRPAGPPSVEFIQKVVARHYGVSKLDIISARRTAKVVLPRQVSVFLAKEFTARSIPEIGRRTGGRDHATMLYSINKIAARCISDPAFSEEIALLRLELRA